MAVRTYKNVPIFEGHFDTSRVVMAPRFSPRGIYKYLTFLPSLDCFSSLEHITDAIARPFCCFIRSHFTNEPAKLIIVDFRCVPQLALWVNAGADSSYIALSFSKRLN